METTIYLIRHSIPLKEYGGFNTEQSHQINNEKLILTVQGEEAAKQMSLHEELQHMDAVYSSHYVRAMATAKYIAYQNGIKLFVDSRFGERRIGDETEADENFWLKQMLDPSVKCSGGESQEEVRQRMAAALDSVLARHEGKRVAIVSHAGAITFLLMRWCRLVNAQLEGKRRCLEFDKKIVIDDGFGMPEAFKLVFDGGKPVTVERVIL